MCLFDHLGLIGHGRQTHTDCNIKAKNFLHTIFSSKGIHCDFFHLADKRDIRILMPVSDIERYDFKRSILSNISKVEHGWLRSGSNSLRYEMSLDKMA